MKIILFAAILSLLSTAVFSQTFPTLSKPVKIGGGEKDAALIIAIEDYAFLPDIKGAEENGIDWYRQFTRGFKMDPTRVTFLRNEEATKEEIQDAILKLASQQKKGGKLWFIFIGHGAPSPKGKGGVLVGVDTQQNAKSISSRGVLQKDIFKPLELATRGKKKQAVVLIDACFSGKNGSKPLVPGLQPVLVTQKIKSSLIFLFAAQNDQYAGPLPDLSRPAYSYLALGALRGWADDNNDKTVSVKELTNYVNDSMMVLIKGRRQTAGHFAPRIKETLIGKTNEKSPDWIDFLIDRKKKAVAVPQPFAEERVVRREKSKPVTPIRKVKLPNPPTPRIEHTDNATVKSFYKGCKEGGGGSCQVLGAIFGSGRHDQKKNTKLSEQFYQKALVIFKAECQSASAMSCFKAATLHFQAQGTKKDQRLALKYADNACNLKLVFGCALASTYTKDPIKSFRFMEKACLLDEGHCAQLAIRYEFGKGVKKDKKKAIFYVEKACKAYLKTTKKCPHASHLTRLKK